MSLFVLLLACTGHIRVSRQSEVTGSGDGEREFSRLHNRHQLPPPLTLLAVAVAVSILLRRHRTSTAIPSPSPLLHDDEKATVKHSTSDTREASASARVRDTSQIISDEPFCANMARVNNRPSTIASSRANTAAPPSSNASDQENYDPEAQRDPRRDKRPVTMDGPEGRGSLPTPSSEEAAPSSTAQKRKRGQATQGEDVEDEGEDDGEEDVDSEDPEMKKFTRYYDPNQDRKKRQQVKRKTRKLDREIIGKS